MVCYYPNPPTPSRRLPVSSLRAPFSQLDNSVESIGARVLRTRLSAEESNVAAQRAAEAVAAAEREEARLAAEALAVKAAKEASEAAAKESEAQREREEASRAVAEAVQRAQAAEQAAGLVLLRRWCCFAFRFCSRFLPGVKYI